MARRRSVERTELTELKALADDPEAQAVQAVELLQPRKGLATVQAALDVLIRRPQAGSKPVLLELYEHYTRHTTSDPACYVRSRIVLALRPLAAPADLPFFGRQPKPMPFRPRNLLKRADFCEPMRCWCCAIWITKPRAIPRRGFWSMSTLRPCRVNLR